MSLMAFFPTRDLAESIVIQNGKTRSQKACGLRYQTLVIKDQRARGWDCKHHQLRIGLMAALRLSLRPSKLKGTVPYSRPRAKHMEHTGLKSASSWMVMELLILVINTVTIIGGFFRPLLIFHESELRHPPEPMPHRNMRLPAFLGILHTLLAAFKQLSLITGGGGLPAVKPFPPLAAREYQTPWMTMSGTGQGLLPLVRLYLS